MIEKLPDEKVHLSLNIESIEGATGVSSNCLIGGIKVEEATQMMFDAGQVLAYRLSSVDFNGYNPGAEDWRSGRLCVSLFYYFLLGLAKGRLNDSVL